MHLSRSTSTCSCWGLSITNTEYLVWPLHTILEKYYKVMMVPITNTWDNVFSDTSCISMTACRKIKRPLRFSRFLSNVGKHMNCHLTLSLASSNANTKCVWLRKTKRFVNYVFSFPFLCSAWILSLLGMSNYLNHLGNLEGSICSVHRVLVKRLDPRRNLDEKKQGKSTPSDYLGPFTSHLKVTWHLRQYNIITINAANIQYAGYLIHNDSSPMKDISKPTNKLAKNKNY